LKIPLYLPLEDLVQKIGENIKNRKLTYKNDLKNKGKIKIEKIKISNFIFFAQA